MFCQNCGKEISDDAMFCEFCGLPYEGKNEAEPDDISIESSEQLYGGISYAESEYDSLYTDNQIYDIEEVNAALKSNYYSTGYNTLSQAVNNYPDNEKLKDLYNNFDETYLGYVRENVDLFVASKSWDDALVVISAAESNVGSNNTTLAQMKEDVLFKYKDVSMFRLAALKDAGNTDAIKELIREMKGYIPNDFDVKNLMAEYGIK